MVVGIGVNEFFVASDATPIVEYTNEVVYLEEGEVARLSISDGLDIKTTENVDITPYIQELELSLESIEKGGYEHFMLKEIFPKIGPPFLWSPGWDYGFASALFPKRQTCYRK